MTPARIDADIRTVRQQFDARAPRFAQHDAVVREVARRMFERLAFMRHPARRVLDVGCGYGASRADLQKQFAGAQWLGVDLSERMLRAVASGGALARLRARWGPPRGALRVCASAERLPLADGSVDVVFSNLMLHWHPAPHEVIAEMARVLRTGGLIVFSSYGPDSGREVRAAAQVSLAAARPLPCVDMHDFGDMLVDAGFEAPVMEVENLRLTYPDPRALLTEIRALGGNPRRDRAPALPSGGRAHALLQALRQGADAQGRIGVSFEIVIGHGWKAPPRSNVRTIALPRPYQERTAG